MRVLYKTGAPLLLMLPLLDALPTGTTEAGSASMGIAALESFGGEEHRASTDKTRIR